MLSFFVLIFCYHLRIPENLTHSLDRREGGRIFERRRKNELEGMQEDDCSDDGKMVVISSTVNLAKLKLKQTIKK